MRPRPNTALRASTALLLVYGLLVYGLLVLGAPRAGAQSTDGTRWSIFAGHTTSSAAGADRSFSFPSEDFGVGGSVEFKSSLFPVPLRATLSYDKFRGDRDGVAVGHAGGGRRRTARHPHCAHDGAGD